MTNANFNPEYVIHSDEEPLRLERQARVYDQNVDLAYLALSPKDKVLDAGCGSGAMTRAIAREFPTAQVTGLDRDATYVDFARRLAASESLPNANFEIGDVLKLPFADASFDVVWSKHLLQWVGEREQALAEFKRVTRPGGRIVCCNFDRFALSHYPTDERLQAELEKWFGAAQQAFGFDNDLGRKLPHLLKKLGLSEVKVDFIPDKAYNGFGGDPERRWNWEQQFKSSMPFTVKVFGDEAVARDYSERAVDRFCDPDVYVYCSLFYVEGRVP